MIMCDHHPGDDGRKRDGGSTPPPDTSSAQAVLQNAVRAFFDDTASPSEEHLVLTHFLSTKA